jgi:adenylate cyclase
MNTTDLTRRLSAIFSADVEGYSRLMRDDEEATVQTITSYRTAMTHLIQEYRGRVVDSPGDNILAEFTSVVDAVNCGVEIQRELAERNTNLPENRRMQFRIGINLGDVLQEGGRIYGDGVNIAARIESLAEAGGISISGTVYDAIENKIGLEYEYLGEQEVKNIDKPVRVYRVISYPGAAAHRVVKPKRAVGKTWRNVVVAIAAVLILGAGVLAAWHFYLRPAPPPAEVASEQTPAPESPGEMPPPVSDKPSIAVLPFANISGDHKEDYLSDGITEQIITALSKTPKMLVIARNSVFTYKGKPVMVQQVSEELGVRYVLEGSVQKEGDRLRITAQLIDAKTGNHIWSDRYDRELKDLFAVQDEITMRVIEGLRVELTEGEPGRIYSRGTDNLEAYLKVLKGLDLVLRFRSKDDNALGRQMYEEAIALDPGYSNAYACLAWTHSHDKRYGWTKTPKKSLNLMLENAQKAVSLDESNANAYSALELAYLKMGMLDKALAAGKQAIALAPNGADTNALHSFVLAALGRNEEALATINKAIHLTPITPMWYFEAQGITYLNTGQYEESIALYKKILLISPDHLIAQVELTMCYSLAGQEEKAHAQAKEVLRISPTFSVEGYIEDRFISRKGDRKDVYINALRKAGLK